MSPDTFRRPPSEIALYSRVLVFSLILFGTFYTYTSWLQIPNVLNKSTADVAVVLIGLSMILSGICYFWNFFDPLIRYRKYLGMVGWAFAIAHVILSFSAVQALFTAEIWQRGAAWPAFTGLLATIIFTVMALISNSRMALFFGRWWRIILRTGYIALILVFAHIVLLRSARWISWYQAGMQTPPSLSLIVTLFIVVVILMRVALWLALKRKKARVR